MKRFLVSTSLAVLTLLAPVSTSMLLPFGVIQAQAQSVITLEKLNFKGETGSISIPLMIIEGSTASKAEIEAFFDTKSLNTLGQRLAQFSAKSISIPTLEIVQSPLLSASTTLYKGVVMSDIRNGVIGQIDVPTTTSQTALIPETKVPAGKTAPKAPANAKAPVAAKPAAPLVTIDMANTVMKGTDLPLIFRFLYDKAAPGEVLKVAFAEQSVGKTTYKIGTDSTVTIGQISMRDFKLKPMKTPLMELITQLQNPPENRSDKDALGLGLLTDMLSSISIGLSEVTGVTSDIKIPGEADQFKFAMDSISMAGGADIVGRLSMKGLNMSSKLGSFNIGEFSLEGLSFAPLLAALQAAADNPDAKAALEADPAKMIPKLDLFKLAGISVDVPDIRDSKQRFQGKINLFEIKMGNHVGPIPANISMILDSLKMPIPVNSKQDIYDQLLKLGYKTIDMSIRYDQSWDEASRVLKLNDLSVGAVGIFAIKAKTELGNVAREVFTLNKAVAAVSALAVTMKSMNVALTNDSLVEAFIAQMAKDQKRKPEDLKAELAAGAAIMVPAMLGDHPAGAVVSAALSKFLANPKALNINVTAKGAGLGAADFIAITDPKQLLNKVDIQATANE